MAITKNPKPAAENVTPVTAVTTTAPTENASTPTTLASGDTQKVKKPRAPRGESLAWDKPRIKALFRTMFKMADAGETITPMRLTVALTQLPEFSDVQHLLEGPAGSMRVANQVKARQLQIEEAQKAGREVRSLPAFSTARGPRLDAADLLDELDAAE